MLTGTALDSTFLQVFLDAAPCSQLSLDVVHMVFVIKPLAEMVSGTEESSCNEANLSMLNQ